MIGRAIERWFESTGSQLLFGLAVVLVLLVLNYLWVGLVFAVKFIRRRFRRSV